MNDALPKQMTALVALADLRPSPTNPRKTFTGLDDLAASIREHGVLQDILARPVGAKVTFDRKTQSWDCDHFEIVAGERRFRAAQLAGLTELPVKVRPLTDAEVLEIQLIENDQREDVKPTEQAAAYKRLVDAVGLAEAAKRTGKSASVVRGIVLLAKCPAVLAMAIDKGIVGRSIAEVICRVPGDATREKAALCVLLGRAHPDDVLDGWAHESAFANLEGQIHTGQFIPLTHRETKELIAKHFTRELKQAPFSRTALYLVPGGEPDRNDYLPKCEACPKRAGNLAKDDVEYAGVRADICTDPECFEDKVAAFKRAETEKFLKKWKHGHAEAHAVPAEFAWPAGRAMPPAGWTDWNAKIIDSELADANPSFEWKSKPKAEQTVGELLESTAGQIGIERVSRPQLAFDPAGKPRTLIRTADARKRLLAAGVLAKPKPKTATKTVVKRAPSTDGPYLLYRLKLNPDTMPMTLEFDAKEDTTPEAKREQAASAFMDWFDGVDWSREAIPFVDYEEVPPGEEAELRPRSCRVCGCTDLDCSQCVAKTGQPCSWEEIDLCSACVPEAETGIDPAPSGEPIGPLGLTFDQIDSVSNLCGFNPKNPTVKPLDLNGRQWVVTGGAIKGNKTFGEWRIAPLYDLPEFSRKHPSARMRENQGFLDGLDADKTKHPAGFYGGLLVVVGRGKTAAKMVVGMKHEERKLCHSADVRASAPTPGPIVYSPGEAKLADVPGVTAEDATCLAAVGITTLIGLRRKLETLQSERGRKNATIYDVLRTYGGAFTPGDVERIGDAIMDYVNVAKAVGAAQPDADAKPAKGKRKAVAK